MAKDTRLDEQPRNINDAIFDGSVRHLVGLERLQGGLRNELLAVLNSLDEELLNALSSGLGNIFDNSLTVRQREREIQKLENTLSEINNKAYSEVGKRSINELESLAAYEFEYNARLVEQSAKTFGKEDNFAGLVGALSAAAIVGIVSSHPVRGATASQWVDGMRDSRIKGIVSAIREGIVDDEAQQVVFGKIKGTRGAKYRDGLLEKYRKSIGTFVRTAVTAITTRSRDEFVSRNSRLFKGVQWVSVLDSRTSPICISRDGNIYPVGKGPRPPAHFNCRSTTATIVKGEKPPVDMKYDQWLSKQPAHIVDDVLGKTRSKLFRYGELPIDKLFDRDDRLLLLPELKAREFNAFDKAGLGS